MNKCLNPDSPDPSYQVLVRKISGAQILHLITYRQEVWGYTNIDALAASKPLIVWQSAQADLGLGCIAALAIASFLIARA